MMSMYKNKILFALLFIALTSTGHAQHRRNSDQVIFAYPVIGATFSQIEGDELKGFDKIGITTGVGAMMNLSRNEMFKLSIEATFSQRGAFNNTNNPYSLYDFTLNYVDIPLMFHFQDPYGGMVFGLGLSYSRLVQQPHGSLFYSSAFVPDTSDMSFLKNDLAIAADLRFTVWRGLKINIRYQYSLFPVKRNWSFTETTSSSDVNVYTHDCYNSSVSLRLLYVFGDDGSRPKPGKVYHHKKRRR